MAYPGSGAAPPGLANEAGKKADVRVASAALAEAEQDAVYERLSKRNPLLRSVRASCLSLGACKRHVTEIKGGQPNTSSLSV